METILAFNAALALAEKLLPLIAEQLKRGEISPEEQAQAHAAYLALREKGAAAFAGPAWTPSQVEPDTQ